MSRLLNTGDLVTLTGYTKPTIQRWAREGRIPCAVKVKGKWQFDSDAVATWWSGGEFEKRFRVAWGLPQVWEQFLSLARKLAAGDCDGDIEMYQHQIVQVAQAILNQPRYRTLRSRLIHWVNQNFAENPALKCLRIIPGLEIPRMV